MVALSHQNLPGYSIATGDPALSITLQIYPNHAALCLDESDYVMERDKVCAYNPHWSADACQVQCRQQTFILTHLRRYYVKSMSKLRNPEP